MRVLAKVIASIVNLVYPYRFHIFKWNRSRRDGRVVEGARLESVYTERYRGFEPLSLRHLYVYYDAKKSNKPADYMV